MREGERPREPQRALVLKLIASAKRSLILIDNWATPEVLDLFAKKCKGVKVTIFTSEHYDRRPPVTMVPQLPSTTSPASTSATKSPTNLHG